MILDEAIKHLDETIDTIECHECREEHIQLREWLTELDEYRKAYNGLCDIANRDQKIEDVYFI